MSSFKKLFIQEKEFCKSFFKLAGIIVIQNMITFSVNVADNIMVGIYSQNALAGAAAVNQIQFLLQQVTLGLGEGIVAISSQYWGQKKTKPIYQVTWIALCIGICFGTLLTLLTSFFPTQALQIFTYDSAIISEGTNYLSILRFTYVPFIITYLLLASLRSMETVKIGFYVSCISLVTNIILNYLFIFGKFGVPELGIKGAAIGTITARILELCLVLLYILRKHPDLFKFRLHTINIRLLFTYIQCCFPIVLTQTLFGLSVSMQTAILGHISSKAIAANSAATTIFQYLKLMAIGSSSATLVLIGKTVGSGSFHKLKDYNRILQYLYIGIGLFICITLNIIKYPLISLYALTPSTKDLAIQIITLLSIVSIGTSYQMPISTGIIRGSGNIGFALKLDLISILCIVYPLSILAAFVWKLPVIAVIALLNSDQLFKCLPAYFKVNKHFSVHQINKK